MFQLLAGHSSINMHQSGILTLLVISLLSGISSGTGFITVITYLGCNEDPGPLNSNLYGEITLDSDGTPDFGTAPDCVERCLAESYAFSVAVASKLQCLCGEGVREGTFFSSQICNTNCNYGSNFPACSAYSENGIQNGAYYKAEVIIPPKDQILIFGGKAKTDTEAVFAGPLASGDCTAIPDVPFNTQRSIALRDKDGRPMVCEGSKYSKSCAIYDVASNSWIDGPSLKRGRDGASATCLDDGVCWVFGGRSRETTEYYDPTTNEFILGPDMPVNSVHGVCTALAPSGLIYMVARRELGKTRAFTFDPSTMTFTDLPDIVSFEIRYPACAVLNHETNVGEEIFVVVGGGSSNSFPSSNVHIYTNATWSSTWDNYPHEMIGPSVGHLPWENTFTVQGGLTSGGEELTDIYAFDPSSYKWCKQVRSLNKGRSFAPAINVESACPSV